MSPVHKQKLRVSASLFAALSLAFNGMSPVIAAGSATSGGSVAIATVDRSITTLPRQASLSDLRLALSERLASKAVIKSPWLLKRLNTALTLVNIAGAGTRAERHSLIRNLPVAILEISVDGGTLKTYYAGGKPRVQVLTRGTSSAVSRPSGSETPDGANPAFSFAKDDPCYYESEEVACATPEEVEDALILAAELEAEVESAENDIDDVEAELTLWCQEWGPCDEEAEGVATQFQTEGDLDALDCMMPSAPPCTGAKNVAILGVVGAGVARWALWQVAVAAVTAVVAAPVIAVAVAGALIAVVGATIAVADAYNCVNGLPRITLIAGLDVAEISDERSMTFTRQ